ncbi:MAG: homoserine kinase [Synechococcales cyanobacterium K44_A2020_017]|nr:homoserine kinase [Synechococcales cyanobacterium K32_A2020_035]MBF2095663.1 homoserine kinase [Synechococcales cyanobacterium K44_A2020_017]
MPPSVTVIVPATTANLGAGFDCIGASLSMYNQFFFDLLPPATEQQVTIQVEGTEADRVQCDQRNLVYQTFLSFFQHLKQPPPPVAIRIQLGVPLARGLGSSATAIVGGLLGANALAGSPLSQTEIMHLAIALEGHPDNVVPALLGGCRLASADDQGRWTVCDVPWHFDIIPVVAIPNFELSTEEARSVLPQQYSRADAIYNIAHMGLLIRGLSNGRGDWLKSALGDRIHQPYRQTLIHGYEAVAAAAASVGAHGVVISGAGPTLLALCPPQSTTAVQAAIERAWVEQGLMARVEALQLDTRGAIVTLHTQS